jgi:hypothetical protein
VIAVKVECGRCGKRLGSVSVPETDEGPLTDAGAAEGTAGGLLKVVNGVESRWSLRAVCRCGRDWRRNLPAVAGEVRKSGGTRYLTSAD